MKKICTITCYSQPDYVRARTLRSAAALIDGVEVIEVKNSRTGLLRYPEVFAKVLRVRLAENPDAYLLTFRGYEMLLPIRLLSLGKPLIYDEFINPIEWVVHERRQVEARQASGRAYAKIVQAVSQFIVFIVSSAAFKVSYRALVSSVNLVLADTASHAIVSSKLTGIELGKFLDIPVGTDETVFIGVDEEERSDDTLTVFYYGNMLPLHGLDYVIHAAAELHNEPVRFVIVGGNAKIARDVAEAVRAGATIDYTAWVDYEKLPQLMQQADLCLAGPFGDTFQAQYVITGKAYQYLAMGRPTLIGMNEESGVFTNKQDVLMVQQGDSTALAETIRWAMGNREELRAIGEAGQKLYYREFSIARIAERLSQGLKGLGLTKLGTGTDSKQKQE